MTALTADTVVLLAHVDAGAGTLQQVADRAGIAGTLPSRSRATRAMLWLWASAVEGTAIPHDRLETAVRASAGNARSDECISFSYCRDWIGACISEIGSIGLDIEAVGDVPQRVARRTMAADDERRLLTRTPAERDRAATAHWCASEAVAKACGVGLPMLLGRRTATGLQSSGLTNGAWFTVLEPVPGLCCAVAGTAGRGPILTYRLCRHQSADGLSTVFSLISAAPRWLQRVDTARSLPDARRPWPPAKGGSQQHERKEQA